MQHGDAEVERLQASKPGAGHCEKSGRHSVPDGERHFEGRRQIQLGVKFPTFDKISTFH